MHSIMDETDDVTAPDEAVANVQSDFFLNFALLIFLLISAPALIPIRSAQTQDGASRTEATVDLGVAADGHISLRGVLHEPLALERLPDVIANARASASSSVRVVLHAEPSAPAVAIERTLAAVSTVPNARGLLTVESSTDSQEVQEP